MKPKFKIGQSVRVNKKDEIGIEYDAENNRFVNYKYHRNFGDNFLEGKITGIKILQEGKVHVPPRYYSYDGDYNYDPPYLQWKKTIKVWKVILGYTNKEMYFFEDDIEEIEDKDIPYKYSGFTEHYRKWMSKESKSWPRDEKGRFV